MIDYAVRIDRPESHTIDVEVRVSNPGDVLEFSIPAWTPGSYLLREFARYLGEPKVLIDGREVLCTKTAKGTWRAATSSADSATIRYDVYGLELTVRTPHIDDTHAYFVGTNAFVYVHGRESDTHRVRVAPPNDWKVFCALDEEDGAFVAPDYDVLADAPFEVGPHRHTTVDILGVPHRFVFWGDDAVAVDEKRLLADTARLIETNAAMFGGTLPYERYDLVFHITESARGGLEHLNSTVLATPWRYFETDEGYAEMLGLICHEHFHVWNIKRIRPQVLGPFDYQNENYTTALWIAEGFTSYFDNLGCLRAGVIDADKYLAWMGKDLSRLLAIPGRFGQTLAQASWDAWIRLYRPDENTPNRTVSYYLKGALVSLALDMTIRSQTAGERCLDDVMRQLWDGFLEDGAGYDEHAMAETIQAATGVDVDALLSEWVHGTSDPDFRALLATHGVEVEREGSDGGWLGVVWDSDPAGAAIRTVRTDGPVHGTSLAAGDVVVAIDGRQVRFADVSKIGARLKPGTEVTVHAFRRGRLFATTVTPSVPPRETVKLSRVAAPSDEQRALWERWTGSAWEDADA